MEPNYLLLLLLVLVIIFAKLIDVFVSVSYLPSTIFGIQFVLCHLPRS